jgi:hypothetical protein
MTPPRIRVVDAGYADHVRAALAAGDAAQHRLDRARAEVGLLAVAARELAAASRKSRDRNRGQAQLAVLREVLAVLDGKPVRATAAQDARHQLERDRGC